MTLPSGFGAEELIARDVARDHELVHRYVGDVMAVKLGLTVLLLGLAQLIVALAG